MIQMFKLERESNIIGWDCVSYRIKIKVKPFGDWCAMMVCQYENSHKMTCH